MLVKWNKIQSRFEIDEWTIKRFKDIYPFFDKELLKMELWYLANPAKHKKNIYRFMVNWLNRVKAQDSAPQTQAPKRDFKKEDLEWRRKFEQSIKDAAPPSDEFKKLMEKLKPK